MSKKYDVIVIGAGIGGLTAAAILARNRKQVLVLEKNPVPGGYAVGFTRNGFRFDASIHLIDGCCEGTPSYRIFEKTGISEKIKFLKPKYLYRSIFPDFDFQVPQNKPNEFIKILSQYFPNEQEGLHKLFNMMSRIFYDTNKFFDSRVQWKFEKILFPIKYPNLFIYSDKTYKSMLDRYLKDEKLKAVIAQFWMYMGLPPSKLAAFFYSCIWHDYFWNGGFYPEGGSPSLSKELVAVIKENKGDLILNNEVEEIIIENNKAVGVKTKKGEYFQSEIVISNIDAKKTFYNLVKKADTLQEIRKKVANMEPSISMFQVYLGVDLKIKDANSIDYEIFVNPDYNLDSHYEASLNNNISNAPIALTLYFNLYNGSSLTKNDSTMSIAMLSGYDFWHNLSKQEYDSKKKEFANILIERAEKIIPGLSNYLKFIEVATPLTMERHTSNHKGAIYGWNQKIPQSGVNRFSQNTKIDNLYLASAWTYPGGGIIGVWFVGSKWQKKF